MREREHDARSGAKRKGGRPIFFFPFRVLASKIFEKSKRAELLLLLWPLSLRLVLLPAFLCIHPIWDRGLILYTIRSAALTSWITAERIGKKLLTSPRLLINVRQLLKFQCLLLLVHRRKQRLDSELPPTSTPVFERGLTWLFLQRNREQERELAVDWIAVSSQRGAMLSLTSSISIVSIPKTS